MTYRVIIQPRAERDIVQRTNWVLEESRSAARALRWLRGIRGKIASLARNPSRCPVDSDSDAYGEEVRVLLYGRKPGIYRVLFAIRGNAVHVLTVRHSAQRSLAEEMEDSHDENNPIH